MMPWHKERGAVLLVVLVALALLAALAGAVTRMSRSEILGLQAERAQFQRENLMHSALAKLQVDLENTTALPRDGTPTRWALPGGTVEIQVQAANGLINPNTAREPLILAVLIALQASPAQAARLASAIMAARAGQTEAAFRSLSEVALLFVDDPALWQRLRPYLTLLGKTQTLDPTTAPRFLQAAAPVANPAGIDFYNTGQTNGRDGYFEVSLRIVDPAAKETDHANPLLRASVLLDAQGVLHFITLDWPISGLPISEGS